MELVPIMPSESGVTNKIRNDIYMTKEEKEALATKASVTGDDPRHNQCEETFFENSSSNICKVRKKFLSLQVTQLVRKGERVMTYW